MKISPPATQDEEARPKAPPNDPQRQGNIWHRYEQLESMTKSLAGVNQQMVLEKTKHQRGVYLSHVIKLTCDNGWTPYIATSQTTHIPTYSVFPDPVISQAELESASKRSQP